MEIESEGWQATRKARFYVVGLTGLPCQSISSLVLALFSASIFRSSVLIYLITCACSVLC
jgi:hypothetical protein